MHNQHKRNGLTEGKITRIGCTKCYCKCVHNQEPVTLYLSDKNCLNKYKQNLTSTPISNEIFFTYKSAVNIHKNLSHVSKLSKGSGDKPILLNMWSAFMRYSCNILSSFKVIYSLCRHTYPRCSICGMVYENRRGYDVCLCKNISHSFVDVSRIHIWAIPFKDFHDKLQLKLQPRSFK